MSVTLPINVSTRRMAAVTCTAGQMAIPYNFPLLRQEDIRVTRTRAGATVELTLGADFTVTGVGAPLGGAVLLQVGALAGDIIVVDGDAVISRLSSISQNGRFSSAQIDLELDLAVIRDQELRRDVDGIKTDIVAGSGISLALGTDGKLTITNIGVPNGGSGNVVGPASAVNGNLPVLSGPSGRLLADSGIPAAKVVQGPASSVDRRVAILSGSSGTVIADSGISIDQSWSFRNRLINGSFDIWQRGTSQSTTGYGSADRWAWRYGTGGTYSISRLSSNGDTALPEGILFYLNINQTAAPSVPYAWTQRLESVRALAGRTCTVSFWARRGSGVNGILPYLAQRFGTGGSPSSEVVVNAAFVDLTSSWARYTATFTLPNTTGKILGTNGDDHLELGLNIQTSGGVGATGSIDIASVELLDGAFTAATAPPPERRPIGLELALSQRFFFSLPDNPNGFNTRAVNYSSGSANIYINYQLPVAMRTLATVTAQIDVNDGAIIAPGSISVQSARDITITHSGVPAGQWVDLRTLTANAEL